MNALSEGLAQAKGESLLVVEKQGQLSGIALGTEGAVVLRGKRYNAPAADFEYALDAGGQFTATPIHRAIDTVEIAPAENVFTDRASVSFSIPTQDTRDIEFRYTLDGSDPTLESPPLFRPLRDHAGHLREGAAVPEGTRRQPRSTSPANWPEKPSAPCSERNRCGPPGRRRAA